MRVSISERSRAPRKPVRWLTQTAPISVAANGVRTQLLVAGVIVAAGGGPEDPLTDIVAAGELGLGEVAEPGAAAEAAAGGSGSAAWLVPGQVFDAEDMPMGIPDTVWMFWLPTKISFQFRKQRNEGRALGVSLGMRGESPDPMNG
jgi:hypothetical protein